MTLVATWVRKNGTLRELVVVSDSRLSGGESWDACPKVVPLPRPATVIAMSGDATEAYAFLLQAINTCNLLDGHVSGRTDIAYLAKKLRDVFADSRTHVTDLPVGESKASLPVLDVVLLGWSWRRSRFEVFSFRYDETGKLRMNVLSELDEQRAYGVYLFGDAAKGARGRLSALLKERGRPLPRRGDPQAKAIARAAYLDWEPLEVLLETIANTAERTVGGVPQICRIY